MTSNAITATAAVTIKVQIAGQYHEITLDQARKLQEELRAAIYSVTPPPSGNWRD